MPLCGGLWHGPCSFGLGHDREAMRRTVSMNSAAKLDTALRPSNAEVVPMRTGVCKVPGLCPSGNASRRCGGKEAGAVHYGSPVADQAHVGRADGREPAGSAALHDRLGQPLPAGAQLRGGAAARPLEPGTARYGPVRLVRRRSTPSSGMNLTRRSRNRRGLREWGGLGVARKDCDARHEAVIARRPEVAAAGNRGRRRWRGRVRLRLG